MTRRRRIAAACACACAALAAAAAAAAWLAVRAHRESARVAERKAVLERFGIVGDGKSEFTALPSSLVHNGLASRIGERLFTDRRLARSPYHMCAACHVLDGSGTDGQVHGGVLTRSAYNAVFADVFLRDCSVTGLPALVRHMVESGDRCGGGDLSNVVARLSADIPLVTRFQFAYEDGLTEANVLDSVAQFMRTLVASGTAFDRWCAGGKDAFDASQTRGSRLFLERSCISCHGGPAMGGGDCGGRKATALRGLSRRRTYMSDGARTDLGAVVSMMPGGDMDETSRAALVSFLKTL